MAYIYLQSPLIGLGIGCAKTDLEATFSIFDECTAKQKLATNLSRTSLHRFVDPQGSLG